MTTVKKLDPELIAKIKNIQMKSKHLVNDVFAGEYQSAFKGRGMEFEEVREYQVGDDIRNIDWNVTARTRDTYIKLYKDERELTAIFIVDVSASARFGSVKKFKNEVAAEITALLAYTALRNNDKVGLIIFSDHVEHYIPPKKGRGHVWQLIRDILSYESNAHKTDLGAPLEFLNRVIKKRAITFFISDFLDDGFDHLLRSTARRHELVAISISDPRELKLPNIGYIELEDAETGESILINTNDLQLMNTFSKKAKQQVEDIKVKFQKYGIDYIEINTSHPYVDSIIKYFRKKDKGRKRR
jgi:uncharacterized protein (DUF58 family)